MKFYSAFNRFPIVLFDREIFDYSRVEEAIRNVAGETLQLFQIVGRCRGIPVKDQVADDNVTLTLIKVR